jgi:4-amino-4-deoxy-L-arabinose transferase-like glycosyltransferase
LILIAVFGIIFFLFLGKFPLSDPDEARYAEIPREMLEVRDFITPRYVLMKASSLTWFQSLMKPPGRPHMKRGELVLLTNR